MEPHIVLGRWVDVDDHLLYIENLAADEKKCPPFGQKFRGCTPFCHVPIEQQAGAYYVALFGPF